MEETQMSFVNPGSQFVPLPRCARLAAVCAALEGKSVTCPAAMQRSCATLAALRRPTLSATEHPAS
jgi:hypothetical protein